MAKIVIHQEKIVDHAALTALCPFGAIEVEANGELAINAGCRMCRMCCKKGGGVFEYVEDIQRSVADKTQWRGIAVAAELLDGDVHPVSLELLGKARDLAQKIHQQVFCFVQGYQTDAAVRKIAAYGPDEIHVYDAPELEHFRIEPYTAELEAFVSEVKPAVILVGGTPIGRSLAPRAAARFRTGLTADCTMLDIQTNTDLDQIRPAYGGNIMAHINTPFTRPQFATVRYKIFSAPEKTEPHARIIRHCPTAASFFSRIEFLAMNRKSAECGIEEADILVAVGRGLKKPEDISMIRRLANLLGAQLGCSRAVVEAGWLDPRHQIGLSGRTVKPKLIITCGISGAVQFAAGMNGSEFIVAINTDPEAPIFNIAHVGIVGDVYEIIPGLIARIEAMKGEING